MARVTLKEFIDISITRLVYLVVILATKPLQRACPSSFLEQNAPTIPNKINPFQTSHTTLPRKSRNKAFPHNDLQTLAQEKTNGGCT
jgi:hypothetical protein